MTTNIEIDKIRSECWDFSVHACGTSYIFNQRAQKLKRKIGSLKFLGIVVPLTLGGVVAGFGANSKILVFIIPIAAFLTILQLIISAWAIVAKWDDELAYSFESLSSNRSIAETFESLAKYPDSDLSHYQSKLDLAKTKNQAREEQDSKHSITDKETRMGMRYSLRNYQRECVGCKSIPVSMGPSDCKVCGNF